MLSDSDYFRIIWWDKKPVPISLNDKGWNKIIGFILIVFGLLSLLRVLQGSFPSFIQGVILLGLGVYVFNFMKRKRKNKSIVIEQNVKESVVYITEAEIESSRNKFVKGYLAVTQSHVAFINYSNNDIYSISMHDIDRFGCKHRDTGDKVATIGRTEYQTFARTYNVKDSIFYLTGKTNNKEFSYIWRCHNGTKVHQALENNSINKKAFSDINPVDNVMGTHKL